MPSRVVNLCEKWNVAEPPANITLAAATSTKVLNDLRDPNARVPNVNTDLGMEIAARYIQNNTGANLYVCYGGDADNNKQYHLIVASGQQADFSNFGGPVYAYSVLGGVVSPLIIHRQDLFPHSKQPGQPGMSVY